MQAIRHNGTAGYGRVGVWVVIAKRGAFRAFGIGNDITNRFDEAEYFETRRAALLALLVLHVRGVRGFKIVRVS